jgi:hypothetical protein
LPAFMPGKRTLVSPSLPQKTVGDGRPMYMEQGLKKVHKREIFLTRFLPRIYVLYKGPRFRGFKDFDVLFVFAKLFEFFEDYPLEAISRGFKILAEVYSGDFNPRCSPYRGNLESPRWPTSAILSNYKLYIIFGKILRKQ